MPTPVRTTNRRGVKVTKNTRTIRLTLDESTSEIALLLAKSVSQLIDAFSADIRSKTSIEQTKFAHNIEMRKRVFELIGPQVKTVGGMAPLGRTEDKP